jgi:cytochrome c553
MIRFSIAAAACALAFGAAAQQHAPPPPAFAASNLTPSGVRAMAANCAACHGTEGRAAPGSTVPGLAGRSSAEIADIMAQFREGKRSTTVMQQIAKGFTEAEVAAISDYFSRQSR